MSDERRRPAPNFRDPWILARLQATELGREAIRRYEASKRPGLGQVGAVAERRIAERKAREALDHDDGGGTA